MAQFDFVKMLFIFPFGSLFFLISYQVGELLGTPSITRPDCLPTTSPPRTPFRFPLPDCDYRMTGENDTLSIYCTDYRFINPIFVSRVIGIHKLNPGYAISLMIKDSNLKDGFDLPEDLWRRVKNLTIIDTRIKILKQMKKGLSGIYSNIEIFHLEKVFLPKIPEDFFHGMTNLRVLEMINCSLEEIHEKAFDPFANKIHKLDIRDNKFTTKPKMWHLFFLGDVQEQGNPYYH